MAPDFDFNGEVRTANGDIAHWKVGSVENFVIYNAGSEAENVLAPLDGKNAEATGLKSVTGTKEGTLNHLIGNNETLDPDAVIRVQVRRR